MNSCNSIGQNQNNLSENDENLESIIDELNETISSKNFCNGTYSDLIEIVYAYPDDIINKNGIIWNSTLFSKLALVDFSDLDLPISNHDFKKIKNLVLRELIQTKIILRNFILKLKKIEVFSREDIEKKNTSISILEKDIKIIEIHIEGLPFELEKAGYDIGYLDKDYELGIQNLDKLNSFIFPTKVSEDPEMVTEVYDYLSEKLNENGTKLSNKDKRDFKLFLDKILEIIPGYKYEPKIKPELINHPLLKTKIHRDDYMKMFNIMFSICKVPQRCKIGPYGSFNDNDDFFGVPNDDQYKYKTLKELLLMFIHEPTHYINLKNNKKHFGNQKMVGNVEKEEGLAEMLESLFEGYNFDSVNIVGISTPRILIGEILNGDDLMRFTEIYRKIGIKKGTLLGNFLRTKRCYPLKYKGTGKKDLSYPYGKKVVNNYLRNKKPKKLLYLGKTSVEYIELQNRFSSVDIGDEVIYPLVVAELLLYYIVNNFNIDHEDFIVYMDNKYDFLGLKEFTTIRDKFPKDIAHQLNSIREMVRKTIK